MAKSKLSNSDLKKFRSEVARLKKAGLINPKIDARKQKPTRYMQQKIKRLKDVIEGERVSVKVDKVTAARYKASGFFVFNDRVVVSKDRRELASVDKYSGLIRLQRIDKLLPFEKVVMPYGIGNMDQFLEEASKSPPDPKIWAAKKNPTDYWAFTYYGNNSLVSYPDLGLLGEFLSQYRTADEPQTFQHLVLYRTNPDFWTAKVYREKDERRKARRRAYREARQQREGGRVIRAREVAQTRKETFEEMTRRHAKEQYDRKRARMEVDADFALREREKAANKKRRQRAAKRGK